MKKIIMHHKMSREERLGRALFKLYGLEMKTKKMVKKQLLKDPELSKYTIEMFDFVNLKYVVKPFSTGIYWCDDCVYTFNDWATVLIGDRKAENDMHKMSLNDFIDHYKSWYSYSKISHSLVQYDSIDELEVKLTLMGVQY